VTITDDKSTDELCPSINTVGNLDSYFDPGESMTCTATYTIQASDVGSSSIDASATDADAQGLDAHVMCTGAVTNTAFAHAFFGTTPITSNQAQATVTWVKPPTLKLVKTASPLKYSFIGQTIAYSYVVTNTGSVPLSGPFTVQDNKSTNEWCPATASLAPGASITCTATYKITSNDVGSSSSGASETGDGVQGMDAHIMCIDSVTNTAYAYGYWGQQQIQSNQAQATVEYVKPGTIIFKKKTVTYQGTFNFSNAPGLITTGGSVVSSFSITANTSITGGYTGNKSFPVAPGTYAVTEVNLTSPWRLTGLSCSESGGTGNTTKDLASRKATIRVESGETVTCTYTNSK
jgi:hypothetical protein